MDCDGVVVAIVGEESWRIRNSGLSIIMQAARKLCAVYSTFLFTGRSGPLGKRPSPFRKKANFPAGTHIKVKN